MTVYDDKGNAHPEVGTGSASFWHRPTNRYPGCSCPPHRYNPSQPKPTNPDCGMHGQNPQPARGHSLRDNMEMTDA